MREEVTGNLLGNEERGITSDEGLVEISGGDHPGDCREGNRAFGG